MKKDKHKCLLILFVKLILIPVQNILLRTGTSK